MMRSLLWDPRSNCTCLLEFPGQKKEILKVLRNLDRCKKEKGHIYFSYRLSYIGKSGY